MTDSDSLTAAELVAIAPVIPVVVLHDPDDAVPLARALAAGGIPIVELTLRTPRALEAIRAIADEVPEVAIGAGTILRPEDIDRALEAGSQFLVSPGASARLLDALVAAPVPALPGVSTPSEAITAWERGFSVQKLFPAVASGGIGMLSSLASPLPGVRFCPTGGIGVANAREFLALGNVACVGGSWLTPTDLIAAKDWDAITRLAADAARLRPAA